jgi:hypothetical protein
MERRDGEGEGGGISRIFRLIFSMNNCSPQYNVHSGKKSVRRPWGQRERAPKRSVKIIKKKGYRKVNSSYIM